MRPIPSGIARLVCATLLAAPLPAAAADAVLTYGFRLGGFDVARADVTLDLPESAGQGSYRVRSTLLADGVVGMVTSFTSTSDARGRLAAAEAVPQAFRTDSTWRGEDRVAALTWSDAGPYPEALVQPPPEADEREPVPRRLTAGSLDPLSALLQLLADAADDGTVEAPVTVYDGRRLYRLSVEELTEEIIETPLHAGTGWRAGIRYDQLGGASRKWESRDEVAAEALLAPGAGFGLPIPVPLRIVVPMRTMGALVVELVAARPGEPS